MKTLVGSLLLLSASFCLADVAIYNGIQIAKTTSLEITDTQVDKFIEVVDLANSQLVTITLDAKKGRKTFFVGSPLPVVITEVQSSRGNNRSSTVLVQASTVEDPTTGVLTINSSLQQGLNGSVIIKGTAPASLPRNLQGFASLVTTAGNAVTSTPAIAPELVEVKSVATLDPAASLASNNAGDGLLPAVQRVEANLVARGFADGTVQAQ